MVRTSLVVLLGLGKAASQEQIQHTNEPPAWLSDDAKDIWKDVRTAEKPYDKETCDLREKVLRGMMGTSGKQAEGHRGIMLKEIGFCDFIKGAYGRSTKRFDSSIGEMGMSEDYMLKDPQWASLPLMRDAAKHMQKGQITLAATAMRRSHCIYTKFLHKLMKSLHTNMLQQLGESKTPSLQALIDDLPGYGVDGQYLPKLMPQVPTLRIELPFAAALDKQIDKMDKLVEGYSPKQQRMRLLLGTSKNSRVGSLLYVRALGIPNVMRADNLKVISDMIAKGVITSFKEESNNNPKGQTLVKRTKEGSGCKSKGFDKTCEALAKVNDLKSNPFGETRTIILKPGTEQQLDSCNTNANIGILLSNADGVSVRIGKENNKNGEFTELTADVPIGVDYCTEIFMTASKPTTVLFGQAWHPEFASIERTQELRARDEVFGFKKEEINAAASIINAEAKSSGDKAQKQFIEDNEFHKDIFAKWEAEQDAEAAEDRKKNEAKRVADELSAKEKEEKLKELEKKREEKKAREAANEEKKAARKKQLEEERANRDPWLNAPEVVEAEKKLDELKEARREANVKLEFDLTASLTKEISAQERVLKKATKVARKAWKKANKAAGGAAAGGDGKDDAAGGDDKDAADDKKEL